MDPALFDIPIPGVLHENIAHNKIEKLILGTLNNRFNKGPPGWIDFGMLL
jgi:hypothetical protein